MKQTRRQFLQQGSALTAAGWLTTLQTLQEASAQTVSSDYRALVCVFLEGGMDHVHTLPPVGMANGVTTSDYALYNAVRPAARHSHEVLSKLGTATEHNGKATKDYALTPHMPKLRSRFAAGNAAILMNVGPLRRPTVARQRVTPGEFDFYDPTELGADGLPKTLTDKPPRVGSHNDQQQIWQTGGVEGNSIGWGGLMTDRLASTLSTGGNPSLTGLSVNSASPLLAGNTTSPLQISGGTALSVPLHEDPLRTVVYGSSAVTQAASLIFGGLGTSSLSYLEQNVVAIHRRAVNADNALRAAPPLPRPNETVPSHLQPFADIANDNELASGLRNVARAIQARDTINAPKRQVFFVSLGGWDNHSGLNGAAAGNHKKLDDAIDAFQRSIEAMGLANNVTLFTASDFGRTLTANGDGTDHGWGGHHFIVGGKVQGGKIHGAPLSFDHQAINTVRYGFAVSEMLTRGVAVPTTSVHQYTATLAKWMGITDADMPKVIKDIDHYKQAGQSGYHAAWPRYLDLFKA